MPSIVSDNSFYQFYVFKMKEKIASSQIKDLVKIGKKTN